MRIMLKIGGAQLEQPGPRAQLCAAIAAATADGHEVVVVHGGGNQIREASTRMGLEDRYHDGLRITDAATAEVVLMVLGGKVNRLLVAALQQQGVRAAGISGADGNSFTADRLERAGVDLGYVGTIGATDPQLVETLLGAGFVPVIATVAPDAAGAAPFYNINADHAAGPLARAFGCDAVLFLTDVDGVLAADGGRIAQLTPDDCVRLVANGTARGGMLPKLEAARRALHDNPTATVKIAPAGAPDCVRQALDDGVGTRFITATAAPPARPAEPGGQQHG